MGAEFISDVLQPLAVFGGIAMVIWASAKAKLEHRKLDMQRYQPPPQIVPNTPQNDTAVLQELQGLKRQIGQMQDTAHQFDLSFDAALGRLEDRVSRIETKEAATRATPTVETDHLQNGTR